MGSMALTCYWFNRLLTVDCVDCDCRLLAHQVVRPIPSFSQEPPTILQLFNDGAVNRKWNHNLLNFVLYQATLVTNVALSRGFVASPGFPRLHSCFVLCWPSVCLEVAWTSHTINRNPIILDECALIALSLSPSLTNTHIHTHTHTYTHSLTHLFS